MRKRILALVCAGILVVNLVPVENWNLITHAEEAETESVTEENDQETEAEDEEEPEEEVQKPQKTQKAKTVQSEDADEEPEESEEPDAGEEEAVLTITGPESEYLTVGASITLEAVINDEAPTDAEVQWSSSNDTIATVTADEEDSKKAIVDVVATGDLTITASVQKSEDETITAEYKTVVRSEPTDITVKLADEQLDSNEISTTQGRFTLVADVKPTDYCTDSSVTWSIKEGDAYVSLSEDGEVKINELDQDEVTVTFQAETVNGIKSELSVTIKKAEPMINVADVELTYGDTDKKITATVSGSKPTGKLTFELAKDDNDEENTESEEFVNVVEDGTLSVSKAGSFDVKINVAYAGDGVYRAKTEEKTINVTVDPKEIHAELSRTDVISKISDGTPVLTDANKKEITDRIRIADGELVGTDFVDLAVTFADEETRADVVKYSTTNPLDKANVISLEHLGISMVTTDPDNTDYENYELNTTRVTTEKLPAEIKAIEPQDAEINLAANGTDVTLAENGVTFKAGTKGEEGSQGSYWYNGDGVPVTLPEKTMLVDQDGEKAANGFLTADSRETFYVNQDKTYYGPYTVIYQKDTTDPSITVEAVKEIIFDKDYIYTIKVEDKESGIDENNILYGISRENDADTVTNWQKPEKSLKSEGDGIYSFRVEVKGYGYLFVKVADRVENISRSNCIRALVLEDTAPTFTIQVDGKEVKEGEQYKQAHTVAIAASDGDEEEEEPYSYSGIAKIEYKLKKGDALVYSKDEKADSVADWDGLKAVRTWTSSIENLQQGNLDGYTANLDGSYELTVTVYDNCGNSSESTCTLNFDNTAPEYTVTVTNGKQDSEENYYYRADNCGIEINVTDARLEDGVTYIATAGTIVKEGKLTDESVIHFEADEVAKLGDGEVTIAVTVTDNAGNQNTEYTKLIGVNAKDESTCSFILDKTSPKVTSVVTSGTAKGPYDDTDYYYNEEKLQVTFTIDEINAAEQKQWKASALKDGAECKTYSSAKNKVTFDLSAEGKYTDIQVYGQDLAGNSLIIDLKLGEDGSDPDCLKANEPEPDTDGVITMVNNKVVDRTAPVAEITYTAVESDHMYDDDIEDGIDFEKLAYYPEDVIAKIQVTDTYDNDKATNLDASKIIFVNTGEDKKAGEKTTDTTSDITYTWDKDGKYYAGVYGTDRAGNALTVKEQTPDQKDTFVTASDCLDKYKTRYMLIRDTEEPKYDIKILSDSATNKEINGTYGNRYYFNKDFNTVVTVTEDNYDPARIYVKRAYEKSDDQTDSKAVELKDKDGFTKSVEESQTKEFADSVSEDAVYRYLIYGTDRAGNALIPMDDSNENLEAKWKVESTDFVKSETQDQETEAEASVHVVRDTVAPKVDVSVKDTAEFYKAVLQGENYTQKENKPYRSSEQAEATIGVTDFSPATLAYRFESSNDTVQNMWMQYPDPEDQSQRYGKNDKISVTKFNGQQKVRITELTATDLAGNESTAAAGYNDAVSTWMYLDVTPPKYDELAPNVKMKLSGNTKGKAKGSVYGPDGNALYTSDVKAEVTVEDPNWGNASGLYKVYYKAEVNGADWTKEVDVTSSVKDVNVTIDKSTGTIKYDTSGPDKNVDKNEELTRQDHLTFIFNKSTFNYNDVKLTVWAEDNSGNVIKEGSRVSRRFGIDITDPKIEVRYDNNDVRNDRYFNEDRVATITVTERNFDESNTPIDTQSGVKISNWDHQKGSAANGDDDTWTCKVTYDVDGDYTFDVKTTDLAGNTMKDNVDYGNSAVPRDFTIDKTTPIINITFDNEDVRNGKYYNAARTATIEVQEHNFSGDGATVTVGASIAEGSVATSGITGWSSGNDKNVTTVPFSADGDYTMQVEYTDLAGNVAEIKTVDEFTVDTTAPVIEIGGVEPNSANRGEVAPSITYHDINYDAALTSVSIVGYKNRDGKNLNGSAQENSFGGSFVCTNIEEIPENDDVYLCTGHVEDMAGNSSEAELRFSVNRFGSNYILDDATQDLVDNYYTNEAPQIHITEINVNSLEFQEITATMNGEIMNLEEGTDYQVTETGDENSWKEYQYTISSKYFQKDGAYNVTVHSRDLAENENSNRTAQVTEYSKPVDFVLDTTAPEIVISGVEQDAQYVEDSRTVTLLAEDNIKLNQLDLYVDGEKADTYDEEALTQAGGTITYQAGSKSNWQTLRVVTTDKAGNQSEQEIRFLLTSNLWIQYIHNTPMLIATGAAAAALILLLILLKRKKDQKEQKNGEEA